MTDRECLRVEIADCPWAEGLKFQVRIGDLRGSTSHSNLKTMEEVFDAIRIAMELNWKELEIPIEVAKKRLKSIPKSTKDNLNKILDFNAENTIQKDDLLCRQGFDFDGWDYFIIQGREIEGATFRIALLKLIEKGGGSVNERNMV